MKLEKKKMIIDLTEEQLAQVSGGEGIRTMLCPECGGTVVYDIMGLLTGKSFRCPDCGLLIQLNPDPCDVTAEAKKLAELKMQMGK